MYNICCPLSKCYQIWFNSFIQDPITTNWSLIFQFIKDSGKSYPFPNMLCSLYHATSQRLQISMPIPSFVIVCPVPLSRKSYFFLLLSHTWSSFFFFLILLPPLSFTLSLTSTVFLHPCTSGAGTCLLTASLKLAPGPEHNVPTSFNKMCPNTCDLALSHHLPGFSNTFRHW